MEAKSLPRLNALNAGSGQRKQGEAMPLPQSLSAAEHAIAQACRKAGRNPAEVSILVASKGRSIEQIREAASAGIKIFGENYLQEAEKKISELPGLEWHFIGHLQSNKAKKAVELFSCIQSLDSLKLAGKIDAASENPFPVFVEVNIASEQTKFGVSPAELPSFIISLKELPNIKVRGLMCMAPFQPAEQSRTCFQKMASITQQLSLKELSMGMSNDYPIAVEEGSTIVRLGTALFGELK